MIETKIPEMGGDSAIIAVEYGGTISMKFDAAGMYQAQIDTKGKLRVGIYKSDALLTK